MNSSNKDKRRIIHGRWNKITVTSQKKIKASYNRIKDWRMDPKGYFLIDIDRKKKLIMVGYCKFSRLGNSPVHDMVAIIRGKTAIEIVNTLIKKNFISTLQHAGDMGIELHKAEMSLNYGFKYIQDKELKVN